jgi:hypothetical protein
VNTGILDGAGQCARDSASPMSAAAKATAFRRTEHAVSPKGPLRSVAQPTLAGEREAAREEPLRSLGSGIPWTYAQGIDARCAAREKYGELTQHVLEGDMPLALLDRSSDARLSLRSALQ